MKATYCSTAHCRQDGVYEVIGADEASQRALDTDPASFKSFLKHCVRGAAAFGRDVEVTPKYKGWMREAGFVDVVEKTLLAP